MVVRLALLDELNKPSRQSIPLDLLASPPIPRATPLMRNRENDDRHQTALVDHCVGEAGNQNPVPRRANSQASIGKLPNECDRALNFSREIFAEASHPGFVEI